MTKRLKHKAESVTLLAFVAALITCIVLRAPILVALLIGYVLFAGFALYKHFSARKILHMSWEGIWSARFILINFVLIGMLTAAWRASGTIPFIVSEATFFLNATVLVVATFLLNCLVSFLTGTSFGTAATMGVICVTLAQAVGVDPLIIGGAILSGCYFGDRCSPVSTSGLLVAQLTGTKLFENILPMTRIAIVPYIVTCGIYTGISFVAPAGNAALLNVTYLFSMEFVLEWYTLAPAILLLALALLRVRIMITLAASILAAGALCIVLQNMSIDTLCATLIFGYQANTPEAAALINGGGILSMTQPLTIVGLASAYSGIFKATGLIDPIKDLVAKTGDSHNAFGITLATSVATSMIACNQTLAILMTSQLCNEIECDKKKLMLNLEDSAVLVAPLIPWSIAASVPLAACGVSTASILFACYLYLVPLWHFATSYFSKKKENSTQYRFVQS